MMPPDVHPKMCTCNGSVSCGEPNKAASRSRSPYPFNLVRLLVDIKGELGKYRSIKSKSADPPKLESSSSEKLASLRGEVACGKVCLHSDAEGLPLAVAGAEASGCMQTGA